MPSVVSLHIAGALAPLVARRWLNPQGVGEPRWRVPANTPHPLATYPPPNEKQRMGLMHE